MEAESLAGLERAFQEWRSTRRHSCEAVPEHLLRRARQAARVHGPSAVLGVTKLRRERLGGRSRGRARTKTRPTALPKFSRLEIPAPTLAARPFAEVETATGLKLRFFVQTEEALEILSSLCGAGGAR